MNPTTHIRHGADTLTRPQVIYRHMLALIQETSIKESAFAASVRGHYEESFPEHAREITFSDHADPATRMKRDAEKLFGYFGTATARPPIELEESIVAAFPEDRREALVVELARRIGRFAPKIPDNCPACTTASLGVAIKETGEAITAMGEPFSDGVLDERDLPHLPNAIQQIDEAIAALMSIRERMVTIQREAGENGS